jgi:GH24 family phage-related lysozyme (muramidase)
VDIHEAGLKLVKSFEGCSLRSYKCPAGVITLGYGHTGTYKGKPLTLGMTITQQEAEELLKQDLVRYENYVNNLHLNLNENQFSALVSFTYNCGAGCLASLCKGRNLKQISEALLLYNKAGGKVLAGLTRRRKAEQELFNTPVNVTSNVTSPKLPYKVKTKCDLNIRRGAGVNHPIIRKARAGEILTVWAIETNGNTKWGRNGNEYFSLAYCQPV